MVKQDVSRKIKVLTARYVQLLNERRVTEAEKVLEQIKEELKPTPWNRGYYNALEGMALALKSKDDHYLYINRIDPKDKKGVDKLQREFSRQSRSPLQDDFDKGYFAAWLEYIHVLSQQGSSPKPLNDYISTQKPL